MNTTLLVFLGSLNRMLSNNYKNWSGRGARTVSSNRYDIKLAFFVLFFCFFLSKHRRRNAYVNTHNWFSHRKINVYLHISDQLTKYAFKTLGCTFLFEKEANQTCNHKEFYIQTTEIKLFFASKTFVHKGVF